MKRQIPILLSLFILLALSVCELTKASLSPMPSPTTVPSN
jgi:hypothetical protein